MADEAALQALLDKEAIRELVNVYCRAADRHDKGAPVPGRPAEVLFQ